MIVLAILFGASLYILTALSLGTILFHALSLRLMRLERRPDLRPAICLQHRNARFPISTVPFIASWLRLYCTPYSWRLDTVPVKAALRLEPEDSYPRRRFPEYPIDRMLEEKVPAGETVFSSSVSTKACTTRKLLMRSQAA